MRHPLGKPVSETPYNPCRVVTSMINGSFESAPLENVSVQLVDYSGTKTPLTSTCITLPGIPCYTLGENPVEKPRVTREGGHVHEKWNRKPQKG